MEILAELRREVWPFDLKSIVLSCLLFIRFPGLKLGTSSSNVSIAHLPFSSHRRHHAHSSFISNMLDLAPQSPAPNSEPL